MAGFIRRTVLIAGLVFISWLAVLEHFVVFNASWSAPHWGYLRLPDRFVPDKAYTKGVWVQFQPKIETDWPYIKQIVGQPGDQVAVDKHRRVSVAGQLIGRAKRVSLFGRPLMPISSGVIPDGHVFVAGRHADSHDSRYAEIGLLADDDFMARVWPLPDLPWGRLQGSNWTERLEAQQKEVQNED